MGRRRAQVQSRPAEVVVAMPPSARVAWTYLAVLLAGMGAAFLVVLFNQTVAIVACASATAGDDPVASCKVGVAIWSGLGGFVLCLAPALLLLKLDWWLWSASVAAAGLLVSTDAITEWWWWAAAALVPAAAALVSADWERGRLFRRWQIAFLVLLDVGAVVALVLWYLNT